jgi:hypothetical protein
MKRAIRVCFLYGSLFIAWTLSATAQTPYLCGDLNNDGKVDVQDLNSLIRYIKFGGPPCPGPASCQVLHAHTTEEHTCIRTGPAVSETISS